MGWGYRKRRESGQSVKHWLGLGRAGRMAQQIKGVCLSPGLTTSEPDTQPHMVDREQTACNLSSGLLHMGGDMHAFMHACIYKINIRNVLKCVHF